MCIKIRFEYSIKVLKASPPLDAKQSNLHAT